MQVLITFNIFLIIWLLQRFSFHLSTDKKLLAGTIFGKKFILFEQLL